ncbi:hypothetical protein SpCBS45565_g02479 [Spizellomyces sp. 'palustris']|nr:hypothetical protein SpCBS45565_g02479 [Spizellomyces sp. 'palustris']
MDEVPTSSTDAEQASGVVPQSELPRRVNSNPAVATAEARSVAPPSGLFETSQGASEILGGVSVPYDGEPEKGGQRRVIAEDPEWNLAAVENLSELCIRSIVANFEKRPVLSGIPAKYRERLLSSISVDLPLVITAPLIPDDTYWKRKAVATFKLCDPSAHGGVWKRLFFELHMRRIIEAYIPDGEHLDRFLADLDLAASYVETIRITQLLPVGYQNRMNLDQKGVDARRFGTQRSGHGPVSEKSAMDENDKEFSKPGSSPDHLDIGLILTKLTKVSELNLYYGVRDCGIDFDWQYFGMTLNDCISLANAVKASHLSSLTIQASRIDDDRCRLLSSALLQNSTLQRLDLSHNRIGDSGARGLAKVLGTSTTALEYLNVSDNKIGRHGARCIGSALMQNKTLKHLSMNMNYLTDAGGANLCSDLRGNDNLQNLELSSNGLGWTTVTSLCDLLKHNGKALVALDLSCNKLGRVATGKSDGAQETQKTEGVDDVPGKMLLDAISQNKYVTTLDIRMTQLSEEYTIAIQGIVQENKSAV